jgi:hypothetical protein
MRTEVGTHNADASGNAGTTTGGVVTIAGESFALAQIVAGVLRHTLAFGTIAATDVALIGRWLTGAAAIVKAGVDARAALAGATSFIAGLALVGWDAGSTDGELFTERGASWDRAVRR